MAKKSKKDDKKAAKEAEKKRKEEEKKRKEEEKKKAKEAKKKGKKAPSSPEPAPPPAKKDDDAGSDGSEEEEDLMGDQSWAKTEDFSGALDDMFGAMLGDMSQMKAEAEAAGVDINAKMGSMGEDAAAAEAEEARKAEEQAAADAEQKEKERLAKERAEKRKNMSKEDKMAKMKCKPLQKKAEEMKSSGTLVDEARYEAAVKLLEDEEWIEAEKALKDATSVAEDATPSEVAQDEAESPETKRPEPEPEPEPELAAPAQTLTNEMTAVVAKVKAVRESKASETDFKQAVALLKAAIEADKKAGGKQEAALTYLAAANAVAAVNADPNAAAKQKAGLAKKLPAMDTRIALAFKDSRTLFDEIDEDGSGTIEPAEFAQLMEKMQLEVQDGQFAAIDTDGSGKIEYDEFKVFLVEEGMQQNSQAFAAGWCALQGNDGLDFLEELRRMALTEATAAAEKCTAELEGGLEAARKKQAAAQAARAEAAAAEAAKAAEEEAAAEAKAAEEKAAREAEEAAAKAAEEEAAAAAAAKAAEEEEAVAAAKAAEEEKAAAAAKAAEEEKAAAAAKAAEEEQAAAAAAKAADEVKAAATARAAASESVIKDAPVMYCKKCKKTGPNPGTCGCPIFMKTSQLPDAAADAPAATVSGSPVADNTEPAWQRERRERDAAERERREREAKEREARDEADRKAAAELKAREDDRARRAAEERRKAADAIARESERIEQRIAEETKRRADAEVARRVAEATQEKLRTEEARRQAAGIMAMPKEDRRRHAEAEVLKQQERRAVKSAGEQFDAEARWRQEQEAHGRRLFATAHGQDGAGPEAGASAGLLGLPPGYSIIGPSVPLEERRADMHARSQAFLGKLGVHGMRARPATTVNQPVGEYLREQLDARRPDGTQGAALAQGLSMLDSIRPEDPLGWLSEYLRDPTSEKWINQARAARQERTASMAMSSSAREEMNTVEYLGRLRPHLQAALRSLVDSRPKNAALAVSDFLGNNKAEGDQSNLNAGPEQLPSQFGGDGATSSLDVDGNEVVE